MEQRDYILREIEKISVVIMAILGRFRMINSKRQFEQERSMIDSDLEESAGITLNDILAFSGDELIAFLDSNQGFDPGNMELFADLLIAFADNTDEEENTDLLKKAVIILEHTDSKTRTFSMERSSKIAGLKKMLNR